MSWQDRDYARDDFARPGQRLGRGGFTAWLWGGSMVRKLIAVNVVLYVLCYFTSLGPDICGQMLQNRFTGARVYDPGWCEMITTRVLRGEVWRLLTSQYLHDVRLEHLLFNMMGLFLLGQELERAWGVRKFLAIYTTAGTCGNLLLMAAGVLDWIPATTPALGASGCVLGLLGAAAVLFPEAEVFVYFMFIRIRTAAILFGISYLYNIQMRGRNYGGDICHLAGLLFGSWWAWRGDRWWSGRGIAGRSWIRLPSMRWPGRRAAPPEVWPGVGEGPLGKKVRQRASQKRDVDHILAKVYEGGIGTLTPEERQMLREATDEARGESSGA